MIVALIDNGSLEPAAHRNLRAVAAALSARSGVTVHAVSWKHSDRLAPEALGGRRAWTLATFMRAQRATGETEFLFVPFFISAQGAIGSALRSELEKLQHACGDFAFAFTDGLAARGALAPIVAERVRETIAANNLSHPAVIVVDHGGPSAASAALRDAAANEVGRSLLAGDTCEWHGRPARDSENSRAGRPCHEIACKQAPTSIRSLTAASMEGAHAPLLTDELRRPEYANRDVVIAMLFLSPGRHAGADGDVAQICRASPACCHPTALVGDHPLALVSLADVLLVRLHHVEAASDVS